MLVGRMYITQDSLHSSTSSIRYDILCITSLYLAQSAIKVDVKLFRSPTDLLENTLFYQWNMKQIFNPENLSATISSLFEWNTVKPFIFADLKFKLIRGVLNSLSANLYVL